MKNPGNKLLLVLLISALIFNSCSAVEGIFKAGMSVGVFVVVAFIVVIFFIIYKMRSKK
jgi:hypothetical protein